MNGSLRNIIVAAVMLRIIFILQTGEGVSGSGALSRERGSTRPQSEGVIRVSYTKLLSLVILNVGV